MIRERHQLAAFLNMGLGKTAATLTALLDLGMPRTLVVAPAQVTNLGVWEREAGAWEHLAGLRLSPLTHGVEGRRLALATASEIEVVSYNNFAWLCDAVDLEARYQAIVFDELSKMKTPGATWFKRMRTRSGKIPIRVGLTGSPLGNHLKDIWGELYAVAGDKPLGSSMIRFLMTYFTAIPIGEHVSMWTPNFGAAELIFERIRPWAFSLDSSAVRLPEVIPNPVFVELPRNVRAMGDEMAHELKTKLASGVELITISSGVRAQKWRQMAGGAVYVDGGEWEAVHDGKLDALGLALDELQGEPALIGYWYRHERERILDRFPQAKELDEDSMEEWNAGKIEMLLIHPASAGHGLNLQHGGHNLIWFTLPWSWELYTQTCGRLARPGQKSGFVVSTALCAGSADAAVLQALHEKSVGESNLMSTVRIT
jgi:hypothetical protein